MTQTTTTPPPETWKAKLADLWYQTRIADNAVQVQKDLRRQRSVERLVKKNQDGTLGQKTDEPMDESDDTVNVGNEIHHHHGNAGGNGNANLMKTLAGVGIAAAGIGAGIGLPVAAWNLTRKPSQQPQIADTDTDTQYGLRIYRDQPAEEI